jgi:diguanylate cyclase (GGDEF)-like protein/PAS domain S-box-containing protein
LISDEHESNLRQIHADRADLSAGASTDVSIVRQVRQNPSQAFDERPSNKRLSATDLQGRAFTLLEEIGASIAHETGLNPIIRTVVEAISKSFGYGMVSISLLEGEWLVLQHDVGYDKVVSRLPVNRGVMGRVARTGQPLLIENPSEFADFVFPVDGVTSEVCVPIFDGGSVAGVLNVETVTEDRLGPHDLRLLSALADKVSVALSRSRLQFEARESERRYQKLLHNLKEIIFETDHTGRLSFLNPAWQQVTGLEVKESLGHGLLEFLHAEDANALRVPLGELLEGHHSSLRHTVRYLNSDRRDNPCCTQGLEFTGWFEIHANLIQDEFGVVVGLSGTLLDVTEEQRFGAALEGAERKQADLIESLDGIFWEGYADKPGMTFVSSQVRRILGYEPEEWISNPSFWEEHIHPDDLELALNDFHEALQGRRNYQSEYRMIASDGREVWFRDVITLVQEPDAPAMLRGVQFDISERKHAERRMKLLESAVVQSNDAVLMSELQLVNGKLEPRVVYINQAFTDYLGYTSEEIVGQHPWIIYGREPNAERIELLERAEVRLRSGKPIHTELIEYRKDGTPVWADLSIKPMCDERGQARYRVSTRRDITARKRTEALERHRSAILESIARHEPLGSVLAAITAMIEDQLPQVMACVTRLFDGRLQIISAPNLPMGFVRGFDGLSSGMIAASCGTAAFHGVSVITPDVSSDPLWVDHLELAKEFRVRAAWSIPIFGSDGFHPRMITTGSSHGSSSHGSSSHGPSSYGAGSSAHSSNVSALGTVAAYHRKTAEPTPADLHLLEMAAQLAAIAIEQSSLNERLNHQAQHDALTGLPNRAQFKKRLEKTLEAAKRHNEQVGVVFLDLDGFKHINDTLGHPIGDQLLRSVAERLRNRVRKTDTLTRMGGDEFALISKDVKQPEGAVKIARKMLTALKEPFSIAGHELHITGSIGIAISPQDADDAATLERHADTALYRAKANGRNNAQCFTQEMNTAAQERLELETQLRRAIERQEFMLHYQPQVDATGKIVGLEALLRWQRKGQFIPPVKFIPVAEESGLIMTMDSWVMREACTQMVDWISRGFEPVQMAVNVTSLQFTHPDFVAGVASTLRETGLEARHLELELTESVFMEDLEIAVSRMNELRALGVRLSIDDFGTGYSSLTYLKRLPVHTLKVDRSFVQELDSDTSNDKDRSLVSAILGLAKQFGLETVAEGVETEGQASILRDLECDRMQGYLFARPQASDQVEKLLEQANQTQVRLA